MTAKLKRARFLEKGVPHLHRILNRVVRIGSNSTLAVPNALKRDWESAHTPYGHSAKKGARV